MYDRVVMQEIRLVNGKTSLNSFTLFEDEGTRGWHLPVQAIANRAEFFGLDSNEESLEFLGRAVSEPEVEGEITGEVHPLYAAHLTQEAAALELGAQPLTSGRTLMAMDAAVEGDVASKLDETRKSGLQRLGVGNVHTMSRMSGVTRAASVAMDASDEVVQQILEVCDREQALLNAWKLDTVFTTCPQIQDLMERG